MFCRNCGKEVNIGAHVCLNCGAKVEEKEFNLVAILGFVFAFLQPIAGLVLSIIAKKTLPRYNYSGEGFARAGFVISLITVALSAIGLIFAFAVISYLPYVA